MGAAWKRERGRRHGHDGFRGDSACGQRGRRQGLGSLAPPRPAPAGEAQEPPRPRRPPGAGTPERVGPAQAGPAGRTSPLRDHPIARYPEVIPMSSALSSFARLAYRPELYGLRRPCYGFLIYGACGARRIAGMGIRRALRIPGDRAFIPAIFRYPYDYGRRDHPHPEAGAPLSYTAQADTAFVRRDGRDRGAARLFQALVRRVPESFAPCSWPSITEPYFAIPYND